MSEKKMSAKSDGKKNSCGSAGRGVRRNLQQVL